MLTKPSESPMAILRPSLDHFKQLRAQTSVPLAMGVSLISLRKPCKASCFFLMLTV